ncbi:hypothetical protein NSQ96_13005 [Caldifermentibacillus hisashii]|uniref:Uncharacterized protein n=1 Tax=Caldifermentibacillus hisashii TaxID=996558 RepID=A0ABU9JZ55_9BACI
MRKNKLNWKLYITIPLIFVLIICFIFFFGEYIPNKIFSTIDYYFSDEIPFLEDLSPSKKNQVEIVQIGEGIFHPEEIKFYFKKDGEIVKEQTIETAYEPQHSISESTFTFNWIDDNKVQISIEFSYYTQTIDFNFKTGEIELNIIHE